MPVAYFTCALYVYIILQCRVGKKCQALIEIKQGRGKIISSPTMDVKAIDQAETLRQKRLPIYGTVVKWAGVHIEHLLKGFTRLRSKQYEKIFP